MRNLQWNEGAPDKLEPGMVIKSLLAEGVYVVGHVDAAGESSLSSPDKRHELNKEERANVVAWAWIIKPYQLQWLEDMAKRHKAKGRGE